MSADAPASADVPVSEPSDLSPTTVDDGLPQWAELDAVDDKLRDRLGLNE